RVDPGVAGAVGLLATPGTAVDVDVVVEDVHARAWHRHGGDAVAALSTVDGLVFELSWMPVAAWPDELARVAALPEEVPLGRSEVPRHAELPFELVDAAGEALRRSRGDVVETLVVRHSGASVDAAGHSL